MKTPLPMVQGGRVLADWVTASLREAIRLGCFEPGEKLDQDGIAVEWGVSRTPVREAVRRLEAEGFVEVQPHRGAFVVQLTHEDVAEVYLVRRLLEAEVARQITPIIPDSELDHLQMLIDTSAERYGAGEHRAYLGFDLEFHGALLRHATSDLIKQILTSLDNRSTLARRFALQKPTEQDHVEHSIREHCEILQALRARDPERAAGAMKRHLLNSAGRIQSLIPAQDAA